MKQRSDEEARLRRYLLGDLDEQIMDDVEVRVFGDKNYADKLVAAEDDLIDDYIFELLSEPERESFTKNFLVNEERRKKVMIARAMEVYVGKRSKQSIHEPLTLSSLWHSSTRFIQTHKLAMVLSLAAIVLLAVLVPLMFRSVINGPISPLNAQRADIERRIAELNQHGKGTEPSVQLTLQPLAFREGGEIKKLVITGETKLVDINLQLPSGNRYEKYRAVVQTVDGAELFAIDDLKQSEDVGSNIVRFKLTADVLPQGDYQIRLLTNTTEIARYNLRVIISNV